MTTIAFLGIGNMGAGIAGNLLAAGHQLTVWNRTPERAKPLADRGARLASTSAEAVAEAEVVMSCLLDDAALRAQLEGPGGFLAAMRPGAVHVCISTISPAFADELARIHSESGTGFVAGPVMGRPDAAAAGELMGILGGDAALVEAVKPVVGAYTNALLPVGNRPSAAATLKLCMNFTVISTIELFGEAYTLAEAAGLDLEVIHSLYQLIYAHPVFKMYASKVKDRQFEDGGFHMHGGIKDVRLMRAAAEAAGARLDYAEVIENKMQSAIDQGLGHLDWSGIYEISRARAGLSD